MIYYIIASAFFIALLVSTFIESGEAGSLILFFFGATTYWLRPDLFGWTPTLWSFVALVGLYVVLGGSWSIFKWHRWLISQADNIQSAYDTWNNAQKMRPSSGSDSVVITFEDSIYANPWKPSRNKSKILYWIAWWPFSLFWFVAYDLLNNIWTWVYSKLEGIYSRITASAFNRVVK